MLTTSNQAEVTPAAAAVSEADAMLQPAARWLLPPNCAVCVVRSFPPSSATCAQTWAGQ
jgi:hypothetical protein